MDRPYDDERLADWVDGRLSARERERFEAELRANPELGRAAAEYRAFVERLRGALRAADAPDEGLTDRIMERVGPATTRGPWLAPWVGSLLAAAAIVVVFVSIRALPDEGAADPVTTARANKDDFTRAEEPEEFENVDEFADLDSSLRRVEESGEAPGEERPRAFRELIAPEEREADRGEWFGVAGPVNDVAESEAPAPSAPGASRRGLTKEDLGDAPLDTTATRGAYAYAEVPVVVFEVPPERAGEVARFRRDLDVETATPQADDARVADRAQTEVFSLFSQQLVQTPIEQQRAAPEGVPRLRLGRLRQEPTAAGRAAVTLEEPAAEAQPLADAEAEEAEPDAFRVLPDDQVFEVEGTAAAVEAYLGRLAALGVRNRATVRQEEIDALPLGRFEFVDLPPEPPVLDSLGEQKQVAETRRTAVDRRRVLVVVRRLSR